MTEDFLHYIWKYGLFSSEQLTTTQSEKIEIISRGIHNHDSGPDFFNSTIRIEKIQWIGNVEIHIRSSDWLKHKHQFDKAYDNVILHVVYEHDCEIVNSFGKCIPTLELKSRFSSDLFEKYDGFLKSSSKIPCEHFLRTCDPIVLFSQIDAALIHRLERKISPLQELMRNKNNDWEYLANYLLFKNLGLNKNNVPFEILIQLIKMEHIKKVKANLHSLEAFLFGQAGLLPEKGYSDYGDSLIAEYVYLKTVFKLSEMPANTWKFSKMRPSNFPTIRLAQLAAILHQHDSVSDLFIRMSESPLEKHALKICASPYWDNAYSFSTSSRTYPKLMGKESINALLINAVVPFVFLYGKFYSNPSTVEKSIAMLEKLSPENNTICNYWQSRGVNVNNAAESQGLIELNNEWCSQKKCLNCRVGNAILKMV